MNAVSASRSNGHLRRCRCASGAFLQTVRSLAPGNLALVSRPALRGTNRLKHPMTEIVASPSSLSLY